MFQKKRNIVPEEKSGTKYQKPAKIPKKKLSKRDDSIEHLPKNVGSLSSSKGGGLVQLND